MSIATTIVALLAVIALVALGIEVGYRSYQGRHFDQSLHEF